MLGGDNPAQRLLAQQMQDPFLKYFRPIQGPAGAINYERRLNVPPSMMYSEVQKRDTGVTQEAADIFKEKTGKPYGGKIMTPKEPEPEPEVETLGKSESELSRRERLRRRRDASLQFAALQKQGGKAQSGV
tara:strand:+ start:1453 stop:1845 length:393 start_codon:yes stop_codon:yes gene_type:complete